MGAITAEILDEKRDRRGRRVMPRVQRRELIAAYRASGVTMAEFARREALNYSTFAGWVAKAGRASPAPAGIKFAEVQLPTMSAAGAGAQLEVRLPDGTVLRGGRVADLVSLVRALRS